MRLARSLWCASTVSGYAANVMNSRRLMGFSKGRRWKSSTFIVLRVTQGAVHVRFGSKADILRCDSHVRFTPESRHMQRTSPYPLWANREHRADVHYGPRRTAEVENA